MLSDYDSHQGKALAVADISGQGTYRLLKVKGDKTEYVVHSHVDPKTKEGTCGRYFNNFEDAFNYFTESCNPLFNQR